MEGLALVDDHFSGVGQYTLGILRGLDALLESETHRRVKVTVPFDRLGRFRKFEFRHIQAKVLPYPFAMTPTLLDSPLSPALDQICGAGMYLFPRFTTFRLKHSPSAVVVYDLAFELHREFVDEDNARLLSEKVGTSIESVERVVTISHNSSREIQEFYGVPKEKIVLVPPAADLTQFTRRPADEIARVRERYDVPGDYILSLCNLEPRKNLSMLVDAYCELPQRLRDRFGLLLVGGVAWKSEELVEKVLDRCRQGFNIMRPASYVLDDDKPALYSGAAVFAYPSHYEGFGMPPLEALACGTPVIASNNSSLPEAVGDAAGLIESRDKDGLVLALTEMLSNLDTHTRASRSAGPAQARKYSWEKSAKTLLDMASELESK